MCYVGNIFPCLSFILIDIDECAEGTHQCEEMQECINQEGGHLCRCPLGYRLTRSASGCEGIAFSFSWFSSLSVLVTFSITFNEFLE